MPTDRDTLGPHWHAEIVRVHAGHILNLDIGTAFDDEGRTRAHAQWARETWERDGGDFLIDYYDDNDDIVDTVEIDAEGFEAITGRPPPSVSECERLDRDYWRARLGLKGALHVR